MLFRKLVVALCAFLVLSGVLWFFGTGVTTETAVDGVVVERETNYTVLIAPILFLIASIAALIGSIRWLRSAPR